MLARASVSDKLEQFKLQLPSLCRLFRAELALATPLQGHHLLETFEHGRREPRAYGERVASYVEA